MNCLDDYPVFAVFSTGYMGDPKVWCYWDQEYPDEGSCGPFDSREEAEKHARDAGYYVVKPS